MQGFILGNASATGGRVRDSKGEKDDHGTLLSCSVQTEHHIAWPTEENITVFQDWPPQVGEWNLSCHLDPNSWR